MTNEQRYARIKTYAMWGLGALGALVVSPIVFLVVKGIIGLMVAGVLGLVCVNFAPVAAMKIANWRIKMIVGEAKQNPIETMVNLLAEKRRAFVTFQQNVTLAATAEKNFAQKCTQFAQQYPARAGEFQQQLTAMHELVERKKVALREADRMLQTGEMKLTEMRAYWEMSQAAQAANKAAGMDTGDQFERLKADTAVDAVFESMNKAFAELEVAAAIEAPALANNPSPAVAVISNQEKVKVYR